MKRIVVLPEGRGDLLQIVAHLASVARFRDRRQMGSQALAGHRWYRRFPGSGPPRPALGDHTRIAIVHPYIVIYEHVPGSDALHVLRVVHGRRNITKELLPSRKE